MVRIILVIVILVAGGILMEELDRQHYSDNILNRLDELESRLAELDRLALILDGQMTVGDDNVRIDEDGIILVDSGWASVTKLRWKYKAFLGETIGDILSDWTGGAADDAVTWIRAFEQTGMTSGEAQIILKVDNQDQNDDTRLTLKSATHEIEFGGVDLFEIRDDAGDTLYFSADESGDIISADFGRFVPGSGAPGLSNRANYFVGADAGEASAVEDHFNTYPASGFNWAGAPFVTPGVADIRASTQLQVGELGSAAGRAFYYKSSPSTGNKQARVTLNVGNINPAVGIRLDDGTDNNYLEHVIRMTVATPMTYVVETRTRVGGGGVLTVTSAAFSYAPSLHVLRTELAGTRWSSWAIRNRVQGPMAENVTMSVNTATMTWTPTRVGLIFDQGGTGYATWERFWVDFVNGLT